MSQIAIIEVEDGIVDLTKIKNKSFDEKIYFDIDNLIKLNFFKEKKIYINIVNDLESRELDMLIFDYHIDLKDYKKLFNILSPLFKAVMYFVDGNIKSNNVKLFISEDCNVEDTDFIKINMDCTNLENSFIDYISSHDIIKTNCFPPIVFSFI